MTTPTAEVILPSPDFDATLAFFRDTLGFRLDAIHPADDPAIAVLSGYGLRLRLERDAEGPPPALRIASADPAALLGGARAVTAPNGATVMVVEADPPLDLPPLDQKLTLCRTDGANGGGGWGVGRAGMLYRDLIPEREGGRFIASHIRIPDGGPVPDNVHFHKIRFQMIYNYKGWVRLVYEDQGESFVMGPGDCVLQPPEIRHRVLECSAGLEVIEIGSPAEHMTLLDHDLPLPTGRHLPERDYGGQRFVLHRAEGARWAPADMAGFEARDLGIAQATGGLAEVAALRQAADDVDTAVRHGGEFLFHFVLDGRLTLTVDGREPDNLAAGDSFTLPADMPCRIASASGPLEMLRVRIP
ncbi:MAG: cupin domain-containing protein [Rhodospirillaceae bacterium]|nr:cupin domain-containing protein [Rhodospirillaceae bacterium]MYH39096.1 cupin domain-containing protein [Rhodospirillaceae bacterium]MYK15019.1 cupin domain-containing protein [Rhodospirillaceae bacterium]